MYKILDFMMFGCAVMLGVFLFAFGIRTLTRRANSPFLRKFLLYLALVLVFLGGKFGVYKTAAALRASDDIAVQRVMPGISRGEVQYPMDGYSIWRDLKTVWTRLIEIEDHSLGEKELAAERTKAEYALDRIAKAGMISRRLVRQEMLDFIKSEFDEELKRIDASRKNVIVSDEERIKAAWKDVMSDKVTLEMLSKNNNLSSWVLRLAYEDIKEDFETLSRLKYADRLKALGMKSEEYKKKAAELMNHFYAYFLAIQRYEVRRLTPVNPVNPQPVPNPPPAQPEYGVRPKIPSQQRVQPMYGIRPRRPQPKYPLAFSTHSGDFLYVKRLSDTIAAQAVEGMSGKIMTKKAQEKNWRPLKKGDKLSMFDLLETSGEKPVKISFRNSCSSNLPADAVLTTWEYKYEISPDTTEHIADLIKKLGDDEYKVRKQATAALKAIGAIALPQLREALKNPDPEIAARAKEIIDETEKSLTQTEPAKKK